MTVKAQKANPKIITLVNQLKKVEEEERKLKKKRDDIQKKIDAIRAKCPHENREQMQGTFAFFCTACGKRV